MKISGPGSASTLAGPGVSEGLGQAMLADGEMYSLLSVEAPVGAKLVLPARPTPPVKSERQAIRELTDAVYDYAWLRSEPRPGRESWRGGKSRKLHDAAIDASAGISTLIGDAQIRSTERTDRDDPVSAASLGAANGFGDLANAYAGIGIPRVPRDARASGPIRMDSARMDAFWALGATSDRAWWSANGWELHLDFAGNGECRCRRPRWLSFTDAIAPCFVRESDRNRAVRFDPTGFERILRLQVSCKQCKPCLLARSLRLRRRAAVEDMSARAVAAVTVTFPQQFHELHSAYVRLYGQDVGWDFNRLPKKNQLALMQVACGPVLERFFTYLRDAIDSRCYDPHTGELVSREVDAVDPDTGEVFRRRLGRRDRLTGVNMSLRYCRTSEFGSRKGRYHVHMLLYFQHSAYRVLSESEIRQYWAKALDEPDAIVYCRWPKPGESMADFAAYFTKYTTKGSGSELAVARIGMSRHFGDREQCLARLRASGKGESDIAGAQALLAKQLQGDALRLEFRRRNGLDADYVPHVEASNPAADAAGSADDAVDPPAGEYTGKRIADRIAMRAGFVRPTRC